MLSDRIIDDAKRGKQNKATIPFDTLFTTGADFLGESLCKASIEVAKAEKMAKPSTQEHTSDASSAQLPVWYNPGMALEDLPDAYKGCPIYPPHARYCAVPVWDPKAKKWLFALSRTLLFGLLAAVNAFNRLPTLATAASRRFFAAMTAAFFDDSLIVDSDSSRGSGVRSSNFIYHATGTPPSICKSVPWGQHRVWLGIAAEVVRDTGKATVQAKDANVLKLDKALEKAIDDRWLDSASASKARGQAVWTGSWAAGRCGRVGGWRFSDATSTATKLS